MEVVRGRRRRADLAYERIEAAEVRVVTRQPPSDEPHGLVPVIDTEVVLYESKAICVTSPGMTTSFRR